MGGDGSLGCGAADVLGAEASLAGCPVTGRRADLVAVRLAGVVTIAAVLVAAMAAVVLADAAPPQYAPGANIAASRSAHFETSVRMVSETVLVVIDDAAEASRRGGSDASEAILGRVTATFLMRNLGSDVEAFDTWFPLMRQSESSIGERFDARVDGRPVPVATARFPWHSLTREVWATWPVTYPPGADVTLDVAYDLRPTGYTWGTFEYVLDTGAGWSGTIGGATVTFRLPYQVNSSNAALRSDSVWDTGIRPKDFEVHGTDVVWRFEDLEPSAADNIRLTVLTPAVWRRVVRAREAAARAMDSVAAQRELGSALEDALLMRYGLVGIADSGALAAEAKAAFTRAVQLAPGDVEVLLAYMDFVQDEGWLFVPPLPADFVAAIDKAMALAPEDERVVQYRELLELDQDAKATSEAYLTQPAESAASGRPAAGPTAVTPTWTPQPHGTATVPPPAAKAQAPAASDPVRSDGLAVLVLGAAGGAVALAAVTVRRRRGS